MSGDSSARERVSRGLREYLDLAIWLGLVLSSCIVYAQVRFFDFVNFDDGLYVFKNTHVQAGLTAASVKWALTSVVSANWMPVTVLSHMLDAQLFQMNSGMHHLVNVFFHALVAGMFYIVLARTTGARGGSAFAAFVFAVHPLHVESVAWVSERKDVLAAFFWFLALLGYVRYTEQPSRWRYFLVVALPFIGGLLSKPMVVTLPFVLLLLDFWPLRRSRWPWTLWEKLPLFTLSAIAAGVTYLVQSGAGAIQPISFGTRIANAFLSYVTYCRETLWPTGLAVFYPYPDAIPAWKAALAAAAVLAVSALAILARRSRPYFTVGWFWFLVTLIPVIGFIQVGKQSHADRYMYIPMAGLLIIVAWGAAELIEKWPATKPMMATAGAVAVLALMLAARRDVSYWQNSGALFERALHVTRNNWLAEGNLGTYLASLDHRDEALDHFENAVRMNPGFAEGHNNIGATLLHRGDCAAAMPHFDAALKAQPDYAAAHYNLGVCQMRAGGVDAAIPDFEAAIRAAPDYADAYFALGLCLSRVPGRALDAVNEYEAGLTFAPDDAKAHGSLGELLASLGRTKEAQAHFDAAARIRSDEETRKLLDTTGHM